MVRSSRGITLLDLVVGLSLLSIAAGGIFAGFQGSLKAWTIAQQYAGEQHNARVVLDWTTRRLRMAGNGFAGTAFTVAAADEVLFFGNTDDDAAVECHRIYRNTNPIVGETNVVYAAIGEEPNCSTIATSIGQPLSTYEEVQTLSVTSLVLQYFDGTGQLLTPLPLSVTQRATIRRIQITIAASGVQFLGPFTLRTQVTIR
jgi:Tfp pilus assembly protein PilW